MTPPSTARTTVISGGTIIAFDGASHRVLKDGHLVFAGDRIVHVGRRHDGAADERIDARGKLVIPGLISTHAHVSAQEGGRLLIDGGRRDFFKSGFLNYLPVAANRGVSFMRDGDPIASLRFGLAQLLRNGVTTVVPFAPCAPEGWPSYVETLGAFGQRAYWSPLVISGSYGFDAAGRLSRHVDEAAGRAGLDRLAAFISAHDGACEGRVRAIVALDEFLNATPALLRRAIDLARGHRLRLTMHFCEQLFEFSDTLRLYGKTPVEMLRDAGALGPDVLLAHALYVAGHGMTNYSHVDDVAILGASGTSVAHAPLAFSRRGLALESFDRYRRAGVNMTLGTDVYPLDLFAEMRMASTMCKLVDRNHEAGPARAVFEAATLGGAAALGRDDLGRLAPGAKADIVILDFDNLQIGPVADPLRSLVHLATPQLVESVFVDGRKLVEGGRLLVSDEARIVADAARGAQRIWDGFAGYDWAGRDLREAFPPSLDDWDERR